MGNKAFADAKIHLERAMDELEDMIDEAQETHHTFISQATGLRRTVRAVKINLEVAERNEQSG